MAKKQAKGAVLGSKAYAAIAAVEGLALSAAGRKRVSGGKASNAERREAIKKTYAASKPAPRK
ncbi:MAG TPA: hypothetical protein PKY87_05735 [Terricaulis sp.]|nr:hypothetical protein [Terricaulis sp.]